MLPTPRHAADSPAGQPPSLPPEDICGYAIVRVLSPAKSYLALDSSRRQVVLKLIDAGCLQRGKLHPNIHHRLGRIRELAHPAMADLISVERDATHAYAVWRYLDGLPILQFVAEAGPTPAALASLARQLILVIESLHALGIVHGRIVANNVIIDPRGGVGLTHVSPLLYDDPTIDDAAALALLAQLVQATKQADSPLARAVQQAAEQKLPLRSVAARLAVSVDTAPANDETRSTDSDTGVRWKTLLAAIAVALIGAGIAWAICHFTKV